MFDPSSIKPPPPIPEEIKRNLGHTKAGFGALSKKHGYTVDGEANEVVRPNRRMRRFMQARNSSVPTLPRKYNRKTKTWETTHQSKPQRERYATICEEKQNLKLAIQKSRFTYVLNHTPHPAYWAQYLPLEEINRLKEGPIEELEAAKRYIKNARKRAAKVRNH